MSYNKVCIESFGYTLPDEVWTSDDVESKLAPLYARLKLPAGRLELMTGIRERRFWPRTDRPGDLSISSCQRALDAAQISPDKIGCLIHGSVCRDHLEPATACSVHDRVGLPPECVIYDVSNACLGILNGMLQAANMIELGQARAVLVVGSEGGRQLVEGTINELNRNESYTRKTVKPAVASLTIGSASVAVLLTHKSISRSQTRLIGGTVRANTQYNGLCQSHQDQAGSEMAPLMATDSEELMKRGIETGRNNFTGMCTATGWGVADIDRTVCHQVGVAHRKLMLESINVDPAIDFSTFSHLGNTGAAALPVTLAIAAQLGFIQANQNVAMLGIGSGINCIMLGAHWGETPVLGARWTNDSESVPQTDEDVEAIRQMFMPAVNVK